ncbi:DUF3137 domain-containing protein [Flammeovirga agarivorans]|uniref:DUF3137 domain-containing protein n=1 Tax=Flammeovirga agarivorans TaxID=2726742 RepID=A0A7X8SHV4_9BACT|nr:DUF3137 domain-containing protein [Flammeovirga agarivorans]NLR90549.1 DUF3137 domain-containing protein [Flammeovirga agarivorans]
MKTFEEFKSYFVENIKPQLEVLEKKRYAMHNKRLQFGGLTFLLIFIAWILVYLDQVNMYGLYFMCLFAPYASHVYFQNNFHDSSIEIEYKELVVREMMRFMDSTLKYDPTGFIPLEDWIASGVHPLIPDKYIGDDLITGSIEGVNVTISEVEVGVELPPKKSFFDKKKENPTPKYNTYFHGFFMIFELEDPPACDVFIFQDDIQKQWSQLGRLIEEKDERYGTYVPIRDIKFRKHFKVYAENRALAEKTLRDDFIQKLAKIGKHFNAKVDCVIRKEKMYVFLDMRKEIFKVDTTHSLTRPFILKSLYKDMATIVTVAHSLNDPIPEETDNVSSTIDNNFGSATNNNMQDEELDFSAPVDEDSFDDIPEPDAPATNFEDFDDELGDDVERSDNDLFGFDSQDEMAADDSELYGMNQDELDNSKFVQGFNFDDEDYYDDDKKD